MPHRNIFTHRNILMCHAFRLYSYVMQVCIILLIVYTLLLMRITHHALHSTIASNNCTNSTPSAAVSLCNIVITKTVL